MRRPKRIGFASGGYALLELTTALVIMAVGLFGVFQMFYFGIDKGHAVQEHRIALRAIENEMETLRALPFGELNAAVERSFVSETPELESLVGAAASVSIADLPEWDGRLKEVRVRVVWVGENGRVIAKQVTTLIAKDLT